MYSLSTDTAGQKILGYTLHGPDGTETFSSMDEVHQRIKGIDNHLCVWSSLADALIDLTWRQEQWGEGTDSRTVQYWGGGFVRRQVVRNPNGVRLEWDDVLGRK